MHTFLRHWRFVTDVSFPKTPTLLILPNSLSNAFSETPLRTCAMLFNNFKQEDIFVFYRNLSAAIEGLWFAKFLCSNIFLCDGNNPVVLKNSIGHVEPLFIALISLFRNLFENENEVVSFS